jgi:ribose 5-phosphate isomerase B
MNIALGSDHSGFELKESIKQKLQSQGVSIDDHGTSSADSCDYPDHARAVAEKVAKHDADFGILVCGTGIGISIAANRVPPIRAARGVSESDVEMAREHNDANVLTLGARVTARDEAFKIIDKWLATPDAGGRHGRRVDKIMAIEREGKALSSHVGG